MAKLLQNLTSIEPFNVDTQETTNLGKKWKVYQQEINLFLLASGITQDNQKRAVLLHSSGKRVREIFSTLENTGNSYEDACKSLDAYFSPKKNTIYERWVFRNTKQTPEESVSHYITKLRKLGETCEYANLEEEVRDQFVCSCINTKLREKFLRTENLSLTKILEIGTLYENSKLQATEISANEDLLSVQFTKHEQPRKETRRDGKNFALIHKHKISATSPSRTPSTKNCYKCGKTYTPEHQKSCIAINKTCNFCGIRGHFESVCFKKLKVSQVYEELEGSNSDSSEAENSVNCNNTRKEQSFFYKRVFHSQRKTSKALVFNVLINNTCISMIGDTGASCSCINYSTFKRIQKKNNDIKLLKTNTCIYSFGNQKVKPVGKFECLIEGNNRYTTERTYVMPNDSFENILSRDTCLQLGLITIHGESKEEESKNINIITKPRNPELDVLVKKYNDIFKGDGKLKNYKHHIYADHTIKPIAQRLRRYPYHLKDKINQELDILLKRDFIESFEGPADWISNMVVVPKKNDTIRLCLDARPPNTAIKRQTYPIPPIEAILDDLNGARYFSKIDLKNAYCQIELDEESRELTTFISERGLLRHKRLIYGLNCASEDFQKIMERSYSGLAGVKNISDDTIIYSKTKEQHMERLEALFKRTRDLGLKFNLEKCKFLTENISFFGLIVGADGIKMDPSKVEALKGARSPTNASELKSFLGLATFCSRFIPNFSTLTGPLRKLLQQNTVFSWEDCHEKAFIDLKDKLSSETCLNYFDPSKTCKLITDASDYGVGAVLLQTDNGVDKPIAFGSKSLSSLEKKYTTTEKECLALVFGVQKFHIYLYGKRFIAQVDHKPLESLNNCNKRASARIERWIMLLQSYDFQVMHKPGKENIADSLSRLINATDSSETTFSDEYINFITTSCIPKSMSLEQVRRESSIDTTLNELKHALSTGKWDAEKLKPYRQFRDQLAENKGIILKENRIVLPFSLQSHAVTIAHQGHLGETKTTALLRSKVFWPTMRKDVHDAISTCLACQTITDTSKPEPVKLSPLPKAPWSEISIDFHGPLRNGEKLFVILDEYSRFPIIHIMKSTISEKVIDKLEETFAIFGYPDVCKSDNGPPFDSDTFRNYMEAKAIHHRRITPLHPQSNAKCERFMRIIGKTLKAADVEGKEWKKELDKLLLNYRNSPHTTTGYSPSLLFFNRSLKTNLPEFPKTLKYEFHRKARQNEVANQKTIERNFNAYYKPKPSNIQIGDIVLLKQKKRHQLSTKYSPMKFVVVHKKGSSITVKGESGSTFTRDLSQAKRLNRNNKKCVITEQKVSNQKSNEKLETKISDTSCKTYPKRNRKTIFDIP